MNELLVVGVAAIAVIAAATVLGPRLGIAAPLVLVAIGVAASFVPEFSTTHIEPEWILEGVLPPLLYSSAVSMPAMNFRREFGAISGLSVVLVIASSLLLGLFFMVAIPDLGFAWGVALGAIVSPTDAVATSIIKQTSVSKRVVAMLDGESLLNDATALVLLRTAIVAATASFSVWSTAGRFVYSVLVAVAIGVAAGVLNLMVRKQVSDPAVNTLISFTVPFVASVPATLLHGSGLVAAVVAGLITGVRAPRDLTPQNRLSDNENWRTVELVLEGAVFLTMGVQIRAIVDDVQVDHAGVWTAVFVAAGALVLTVAVRAAYVAPLLAFLGWRVRQGTQMEEHLKDMQGNMATPEGVQDVFNERNPGRRPQTPREIEWFTRRVTQALATIQYFMREPLGWREGTAVVWAGMRGAVTVAAAQTLPEETPQRSVLVLVAFTVAALSLVVQGGTIGPLLKVITPPMDSEAQGRRLKEERDKIFELMRLASEKLPEAPAREATEASFEAARQHRLAVLGAQREALLDARDNGTFDADVLASALANLDASEIDLDLRGQFAA